MDLHKRRADGRSANLLTKFGLMTSHDTIVLDIAPASKYRADKIEGRHPMPGDSRLSAIIRSCYFHVTFVKVPTEQAP